MDTKRLHLDRSQSADLYRQLSDQLASAIGRGELCAGERLPSERDLAVALGVSRTTAVNAYRELESQGLIRGYVGRGTYVCAASMVSSGNGHGENGTNGAPFAWRGKLALGAQRTLDPTLRTIVRAASDPSVISFAPGVSALECFPTDAFREISDRVLSRGARVALGLAPSEGQPLLRKALANHTGVRPEQILIMSGSQQGVDLVARCLIDPGDAIILDRPGYLGAIQTFRAAGASLIGWDAERGDLDELEDLILRYRPKLLYTTTTFQNPTGHTWPLSQREDVLALATRYRLPIIEDDPYRALWFRTAPPPSLYALDGGRSVIHIETFSKTLAGGLRLAWLTANEAIIDQLALVKLRDDVSTASLTQLVVAELLTSGKFSAHLASLRAEHARRHQAMLSALDRYVPPGLLSYRPVAGGLYLWCRLQTGQRASDLMLAAARAGVAFVAGEHFYPDPAGTHDLRLCFTGVIPSRIDDGVKRLGALIELRANTIDQNGSGQPIV